MHYRVIETGEVGIIVPCGCDDPVILRFKDDVRDAFHVRELETTTDPLTMSRGRGTAQQNGRSGRPKGTLNQSTVDKMGSILRFLATQSRPVYRRDIEGAVGFDITRPLMNQQSYAPDTITLESLEFVERIKGQRTWCAWQITALGLAEGEKVLKGLARLKIDTGKRFREKARSNGLCTRCGKHEPKTGGVMCQACINLNRESSKEYARKQRAKGYCAVCRKVPAQPNYRTCAPCREMNRLAMQAKRDNNAVCTQCTTREPPIGYKTCDVCRERMAKRYADREAKGLCKRCGTADKPTDRLYCQSCNDYTNRGRKKEVA